MLQPLLIYAMVIGWFAYWIVKAPSSIVGTSPVNTFREFLADSWKTILLSGMGISLVCLGANDFLPSTWGKIDSPYTAFITGGSMPSIIMDVLPLFNKISLFNKKQ